MNCATGPDLMTDHIRTLNEMSAAPHLLLSECRPAQLRRQIRRDAGLARRAAREVRQSRLAEFRGRLLRHHARPHPRHRADDPGQAARASCRGARTAPTIPASNWWRPRRATARCSSASAPTSSARASSRTWSPPRSGRKPPRSRAARCATARTSSTSACRAPTATRSRTSRPSTRSSIRKIKAPIMIDTTDPKAVELALTYCQGKSIINSVNLEDGEEKFERICPIARRFGAALVVGSIDEDKLQAQAFTRERKLAVAAAQRAATDRKVRDSGRRHHHRSAGFPLRHRRRQLHRRRAWRPSKAYAW